MISGRPPFFSFRPPSQPSSSFLGPTAIGNSTLNRLLSPRRQVATNHNIKIKLFLRLACLFLVATHSGLCLRCCDRAIHPFSAHSGSP